MQVIGKFDVKTNIMPNGLEKCTAFVVNHNLLFLDSMQFMNSGLDTLLTSLGDNDFEYLFQEFNCKQLNLVKKK